MICRQFQATMSPGESIVVDETMVPWRGRLVFRQYLPAKSHKYVVKVYKICTPEGYTYNLQIYAGKNIPNVSENNRGHTYNVCMDLLEGLLHEGRTLFIDNYYTSVQLCRDLLDSQTYVCGTLRSNRKENPKDVVNKKLKRGQIYGQQNRDGIRVIKWVDKRPVVMISTVPNHDAELKATGAKNRNGADILKPQAVMSYNKAKEGVDISDQMSSYYTTLRKTIKWYKKVFFEIALGTCVVNSWVIYNNFGDNAKQLDILQIREKIIDGLLGDENLPEDDNDKDEKPNPVKRRPRSSMIAHHRLGKYEGTSRMSRRRCVSYYQKISNEQSVSIARNRAKRVTTFCEDCPEKPTMCLDCFNDKHKQ